MSATSGLDYPDDGRAVAVVDWDHDGDQDLWISNRNAPRLRLMMNTLPGNSHWISFRLVGNGTTTNRDAIGARVELVLKTPHSALPTPHSIKTLRSGEGFVAQSSKWLHFGLGSAEIIEKVIVRWPVSVGANGAVEVFTGLAVDNRHRLIQGAGQPEPAPSRHRSIDLAPGQPQVPPASRKARVPTVTMMSMPDWEFGEGTGENAASTRDGRPLLINLWASWCSPCLQELVEFRDREGEIRAAGIKLVAASVDGLEGDGTDSVAATALLKKIDFPFGVITASENLVSTLQDYHDASVGLQRPLPLPSSFLIDEDGRLAVIYKGPLRVDDLLADIHHSKGTRTERWRRSAPLEGRTIEHEVVAQTETMLEASAQFHLASQAMEDDLDDVALIHGREALRHNPDFGLAHRLLGDLYLRKNNWSDVAVHFERAKSIIASDPARQYSLGLAYWHLNNLAEAQEHFAEAVRLAPDHPAARFELALVHAQRGDAAAAVREYRQALQARPGHVDGRNNLAWLLATHPDDAIRDGQEALKIAMRLVAQTSGQDANYLDLLAAAQGECGRFTEAVATSRRAAELARTAGQWKLSAQIETRLAFYERNEPYRERPELVTAFPNHDNDE